VKPGQSELMLEARNCDVDFQGISFIRRRNSIKIQAKSRKVASSSYSEDSPQISKSRVDCESPENLHYKPRVPR
jgi:hypothetical protein